MSGTKKHITALVLLLLVSAPLLVSVGYLLQKQYVRHQMQEQLEEANLQSLLLQPFELHWAKEGKELWVNNQLFDVKVLQATDSGYIVKGLFDAQETAIAQKAAQQSEKQSTGAQLALQWLLLAFSQPVENRFALPMLPVPSTQYHPIYPSAIASTSPAVATPPPDRA